MALFSMFDIGKTALFASQTALSVTSHNIANVNTPGYAKQDVILDISAPPTGSGLMLGRGVTVSGIRSAYDRFIEAQLLGQQQNQGRSDALEQSLSQVEQVFNDAQGLGLSSPLAGFFNAWQELATNPEGQPQRLSLLQKAQALVTAAQSTERGILDTLKQTNESIDGAVRRINDIASNVAELNVKIAQIEDGSRNQANDLKDQRSLLLSDLSKLVDFSSYTDDNGSVTVLVGMRMLVSGDKTNAVTTSTNRDGNRDLTLDGVNITGSVQKGQVGGYITAGNEIQADALTGVRRLIASVTKEVNLIHQGGFGLDASTGNDFFNALQLSARDYSPGANITTGITNLSQLTLDEYAITFDGLGNYTVTDKQTGGIAASGAYVSGNPITFDGIQVAITGAVTATDSFTVSPLTNAIENFGVAVSDPSKIAAASTAAGLPGDNGNALRMTQMADTTVANLGGTTFSGYYRGIVSDVGTLSKAASDSLTFDESLLSELQSRRDSVSGVSLDEEAANLLKFQRSYEAGARVIKVADELLQTLLNL